MFRIGCTLIGIILLIGLSSCSSDPPPFTARYITQNIVEIVYKNTTYRLNRYQETGGLPFTYSFESDGDLDLVIDGKEYEIDSPYDRDKKKKTQKVTKKTSSSAKKKSTSTTKK